MDRELNLERFKKSNIDIINRLMNDTKLDKLHWYYKDDDILYTKIILLEKGSRITLIFEITDVDSGYDNYSEYDFHNSMIVLDIFLSKKNNKNRIFIKRISDYQIKLSDLTMEVIKKAKKLNLNNG